MDERRSPLRLLILSHLYPRSTNPSWGIFIDDWVQALRNYVSVLEVVAPTAWVPPLLKRVPKYYGYSAPKVEYHNGLKVYKPRFIRPPGGWFRPYEGRALAFSARRTVRRLHQQHRFDLLLAVNLFPDAHAAVLLKTVLDDIPMVAWTIGSDVQIILRQSRRLKDLGRDICRRMDLVLNLSQELADEVIELGIDAGKVRAFTMGSDLTLFDGIGPVEHATRQRGDLPPGKVVAFLGRLIVDKGIYDLLDAFARLDGDLRRQASLLYIAGGEEKQGLLARARALGLGERVIVTDRLPHAEALRLLKGCDLMVLPTYAEGTPFAMLESFALRVPMIATPVGGIAEVSRKGHFCDLFPAGDVNALAALLERHLTGAADPGMVDRAERLIREEYDVQRCAQAMVPVLEELVESKRAG